MMFRTRFKPLLLACLPIIAMAARVGVAEDWPHWRGPERNDHARIHSGWQGNSWGLGEETWRGEFGLGSASPIVVADKVYVLGWQNEFDTLHCVDASSGKELWTVSYPAPKYGRKATGDQGLYAGPCSTPEYDRETDYLYTLGIDGELRCWDTRQQGALIWSKNLYDEYDVPQRPRVNRSGLRDYGFTSSPLIQGDRLIVEVGATTGTLIGFDKKTGQELWQSEATSPAGHTGGPVPMLIEETPCVAVHNFDGLLITRIDGKQAGKTVAEVPWKTDFANNVATPAVLENSVVLTSSYNQHRISRLQIDLKGNVTTVWQLDEASKVCSPVIHKGYVYWAWREMHCVDFETGQQMWKGGHCGDAGSLIVTSDDRLIGWVNRGNLQLIDTATRSPRDFQQLAERTVLNRSDAWPHVAIAKHRLFCRDSAGSLVCLPLNSGPE